MNVHLVTMATFVPLGGRLADHFGPRRVFHMSIRRLYTRLRPLRGQRQPFGL